MGHSLDLNRASHEQLRALVGVGDERARMLLEYRARKGGFASWAELENIPGFSKTLISKLRTEATVDVASAHPPTHARSRAQRAAERERFARLAAEREEEDAVEEELEVEVLLSMARMDLEAARAYETAAKLAGSRHLKDELCAFAEDHHRHVRALSTLIEARGGEAPSVPRVALNSLFAHVTSRMGMLGDAQAVLALLASEQFTNTIYMSALESISDDETRALLEGHIEDEQRHLHRLCELQKAIREETFRKAMRGHRPLTGTEPTGRS